MSDTHTTAHIPDEAIHAALLSMAQDNIGADVQGLLMHGFDKMNAKPNALRNALAAALPHISAPSAVEVIKLEWKTERADKKNGLDTERTGFHEFGYYSITSRSGCYYVSTFDNMGRMKHVGHHGFGSIAEAIRALSSEPVQGARPLEEWHEDHGNVVWWAWDDNRKEWLGEPAYIGAPIDSDWPDYHTHWTPHPMRPAAPTSEAGR